MNLPASYMPMDRRHALARGETLPDRTFGSALFADIAGFTPLAESLAQSLGAQRGAEELTRQLNLVYAALITQVHNYHGSVIGFVGDAITCWFDSKDEGGSRKDEKIPSSLRAVACALAMQNAMRAFPQLAIKIGIATGPARRFLVGDPQIQLLDALAGETIRQMAHAEQLAEKGEIVVALATMQNLGHSVQPIRSSDQFTVIRELTTTVAPMPWDALPINALTLEQMRPWVLPSLYARIAAGQEQFTTELRAATALFVQFHGIDYANDKDAGKKLDAYIRHAQRIVQQYDGNILQLTIGDKGSFFYTVFGAPTAHDDDPVRAVRTALDLIANLHAKHPTSNFQFPLSTHMGIAEGQMRVGAYGGATQFTYGAIGDAANLAARLMQAAPLGEIRCDYNVYRAASKRRAFEILPPIRIKGKAGLVRVYKPTSGLPSAVSSQNEIIGRCAEIATIEKMLDAVQAGATRVLFIEGEAGIGKSRLVDELKRAARERGLTGLIGNGQSIEQHTPYRAWRDVFGSYFELDNVTEASERRARVESLVPQLIPEHAPRVPVLNDVLGLGIPENELTQALDANLRQQNVTLVLTALLRAWTNEHPLVLILEDAHWLDGLSWQLAIQVARTLSLANAPLLFVLVNRPLEENSIGQKVFAELRALNITQTLALSALAPDEIVALIANRLNVAADTLPAPLVELVQARANGNPFFAEELVFNLRDTGVIETWKVSAKRTFQVSVRIVGDLETAQRTLPDTLHGLILSRIDRLPAERQFVVKVAAVIGRAFAFTPLHHVVNQYATMADESLKQHLTALTQADFTLPETLEPELTYLFKHIITQEAAYQTLLFSQRRELHRLVAEWYENSGEWSVGSGQKIQSLSTTHYPLLAYHYRYAEDVTKEKQYLGLAAEAAEKIFANDAAIGFYTRWLTLIPSQEHADILLKRAKVLDLVGRWEEKESDLRTALALGEQTADLQVTAQAQYEIGNLFLQRSNYAEALEWCRRAQASFEALNDATGRCRAIVTQGDILRRQGDNTSARQYLELGVQIARDTKNQWGIAQACLNLGNLDYNQSNWIQARESYTEALRAFQESNNKSGINKALNNLGMVADALGDRATMQALLEQSLAVSREIGDKAMIAMTLNNLGLAATRRNENESAVRLYHESLELMREMGDRQRTAMVLRELGDTLWKIGDYARAEARLQESLAIHQAIGYQRGVADALDSLGSLALKQGQYASARSWYEQSLVYAREWGYKSTTVTTLNNLAIVMIELDDFQTARMLYQESILLAREIQKTSSLPYISVGLTAIATHRGLHTNAARSSAALETWRASATDQLGPLDQKFLARSIAQARAALSPTEFDAAWAQGAQMTLDQAIDEALKAMEGV